MGGGLILEGGGDSGKLVCIIIIVYVYVRRKWKIECFWRKLGDSMALIFCEELNLFKKYSKMKFHFLFFLGGGGQNVVNAETNF